MNDLSKYLEVRSQMRTGDLLQWHSNSVLGYMIRLKTRKDLRQYEKDHDIDANHSSPVIAMQETESGDLRVFTNEAQAKGTIPNFLSIRLKELDGHCWWYPLKDDWDSQKRKNIGRRAFDLLGVPYDYFAIAKQAIGLKPKINDSSLYCNEYYMAILGLSGSAHNPNWLPNLGIFKEPINII